MYKKSFLLPILALALFATSCVKKEVVDLGSEGKTIVKILNAGNPATVAKKPIDFLPVATPILVADVRRDPNDNAAFNKTMNVVIKDDTAAVRAANPNYIQLPAAWYTLDFDGTKTGGVGGNYNLTFKAGETAKPIRIIMTNPTLMNPSSLYGIGFTITSVDADGQISESRSVVVEIGAKNKWDGVYEQNGTYVDVTNAAWMHAGPIEYSLVTISGTSCVVISDFNGGIPGYLFLTAPGSGSYYGSYGVIITFDPATNKIASVHNYYGDPTQPATGGGNPAAGTGPPLYAASNGRRAVLDPSGVNAVVGKDIVIKHWMLHPAVVPVGPRVILDETWKYLRSR